MRLKKILSYLPHISIKGSKEIEITGLCSDSRCVAPGNLFVAKKGLQIDGALFITDALNAGAVAILTDLYNPALKHTTQIIVPDVTVAEGLIAAHYYCMPSHQLFMVGITGTSGKTTQAYIVKHLLETAAQITCGLMSTIETLSGTSRYCTQFTTADVITNHKLLCEMHRQGCRAAVMEVSSHALEQGRVAHIHYDAVLFSNLTHEHLDYHGTMEDYAASKRKLFESLSADDGKQRSTAPRAIINADDPYASYMAAACRSDVLMYGLGPAAHLRATHMQWDSKGLHCTVEYQGESVEFSAPLFGKHNVYNLLAAIGVGITYGIPLSTLALAARHTPVVRGRLEAVSNRLHRNVYIDYAHKEAALRFVLETLRPLCSGKLITVFGCGGNRDREKRPRMAAICEELSDFTIVTNDNPRSEDPARIAAEIVAGFSSSASASFCIELDRRAAIAQALMMSEPDDCILIAGKGHEVEQIFAHTTYAFDDRAVVQQLCTELNFSTITG
jgi:UDP-N-acetylmuramoyl-L-alanyl-D-glutamate--2,6-diaminopimelate ligase